VSIDPTLKTEVRPFKQIRHCGSLARLWADGNAVGDRVADQLIHRPGLQAIAGYAEEMFGEAYPEELDAVIGYVLSFNHLSRSGSSEEAQTG
jgi:hypothetical protein